MLFGALRGAMVVYWSTFQGTRDAAGRIVSKDSPRGGVGWIPVSPGPDRRCDVLPDDWDVSNPGVGQLAERLLAGTDNQGRAFAYDPTNGTISDGDIRRVKQ